MWCGIPVCTATGYAIAAWLQLDAWPRLELECRKYNQISCSTDTSYPEFDKLSCSVAASADASCKANVASNFALASPQDQHARPVIPDQEQTRIMKGKRTLPKSGCDLPIRRSCWRGTLSIRSLHPMALDLRRACR